MSAPVTRSDARRDLRNTDDSDRTVPSLSGPGRGSGAVHGASAATDRVRVNGPGGEHGPPAAGPAATTAARPSRPVTRTADRPGQVVTSLVPGSIVDWGPPAARGGGCRAPPAPPRPGCGPRCCADSMSGVTVSESARAASADSDVTRRNRRLSRGALRRRGSGSRSRPGRRGTFRVTMILTTLMVAASRILGRAGPEPRAGPSHRCEPVRIDSNRRRRGPVGCILTTTRMSGRDRRRPSHESRCRT